MPSDTRQALLDAALEAFDRLGYDRATVAQVREAAGVSNGSFFHFFGSKDALAAALFLQALQDYHAAMAQALTPAPSAADGIAQLVQCHVGWVVTQRRQARFLFEQVRADWLAVLRAEQAASNEAFRAAIDRWRQPLVDAGRLLPLPASVFIAQLIGPAQILCRAWLSGRQATSPAVHTTELVAAACRALLAPASPRQRTRP